MNKNSYNLNYMMNEVQDWIQKDEHLSNLLNNIKSNSQSNEEIALAMYYQVADMFHLPLTFSDIQEDSSEADEELDKELHSVFEELAYINYMAPNQNILDKVLFALYIVYKESHLNIEEVALNKYRSKENVPKRYSIFFFGSNIDAHISFDISKEFNSWPDSGAVAMIAFEKYAVK